MYFFHCFTFAFLGEEAKKVYDEAQAMLKKMTKEKLLTANGIVAFYPANSSGDDILIYAPDSNDSKPIAILHGLRQQVRSFFHFGTFP